MTSSPASPVAASPRSSRAPVVITAIVAAVLGLGIGVLLGFAIFSGSDDGDSESRAEQNVASGCAIIERVEDEFPLEPDTISLDEPLMYELLGVGPVFQATGFPDDDDDFESVSELGRDLTTAVSRLDLEGMNAAVDGLLAECADR